MKNRTVALSLLLTIVCCRSWSQEVITLGSLLTDMTDFDAVTRFPSPAYTLKQASSYDRRSVAPDKPGWFANADFNQFIREEKNAGHTEYVMMDADGPGAIVRFWLTTVVKPGMLRFYFDNEKKASVEVAGFDLSRGFKLGRALLGLHSSYEPQGKGGNTLYLPLLYQKHCKVTWENTDTSTTNKSHYYQINYRTYPSKTKVETFTPALLDKYRLAIDKAETLLLNPPVANEKLLKIDKLLKPNEGVTIQLPQGVNAVRSLMIKLHTPKAEDAEKMWREVTVRMEFDGHATVMCPLGDFIGSGYGGRPIKSWYRDLSADGRLESRWVMPYRRFARIVLTNTASFDVGIDAEADVRTLKWNDRTMYFHATFKDEQNVKDVKWNYDVTTVPGKDSTSPIDWRFISVKRKGVYMGNTLSVNNHMQSWYGEGDAKSYVDGERFPSEFGTGLEDYYNTSWAPVVLYQTPFANAPRADDPSSHGYNTFTRTRILDAIPFNTAFAFDLEMLSWDGGTIDAAATTYWYGFED